MFKALLALSALLGGCLDKRKEEDTNRKEALAYYQKKYGDRKVTLEDSIKAGNSGLFGYVGVEDRAYQMSDGYWVYHDHDTDIYADNRQAEEIRHAFDQEITGPVCRDAGTSAVTYDLARTGMESFDECVFTGYYDGDIRAFCEKEKPDLVLNIVLEETEEAQDTHRTEEILHKLSPYTRGRGNAYIVKSGTADLYTDMSGLYERNSDLLAHGYLDFADNALSWYRQKYIEVLDGVYITSAEKDLVLEAGDIVFEEAGTCADVQAILDEKYYAMPVDAEENKKGSYMVHDQRHEKRVILDDLSAPCYRAVFSSKIISFLQEHDTMSVYFRTEREDDTPFMICYGRDTSTWNVYRVSENHAKDGSFSTMKEGYLYYFGTHQMEEYKDK